MPILLFFCFIFAAEIVPYNQLNIFFMKKYSYSLSTSYLNGGSLQDRVISEIYVDFPVCENVIFDVFKYQMVHFLNDLDSKEIHFTIDIINSDED